MKQPERLLHSGASSFERDLLSSWQSEQPSPDARRRALELVGAGAATALGVTATAQAAAPLGSKLTLAAIVGKWLGVGAVAGLATSVATLTYYDSSSSRSASSEAPLEPAAPKGASATLLTTAPPLEPAMTAASAVPTSRSGPTVSPSPTRSTEVTEATQPAEPRSSLASQIALLDRARNALHSGNAAGALKLVAEYQRTYPGGVLGQEAEVLRIDALDRQGNRAEASLSARRFVTQYPTSAHADRLRGLAEQGTNP